MTEVEIGMLMAGLGLGFFAGRWHDQWENQEFMRTINELAEEIRQLRGGSAK